ncbi:hypothetical protein [Dyella sp. ASV21]|uniref:post-PEP-CTERM-1 domain-containing protein n=1 Tax=Dyella sp. ASV21 TaxID=2795114 RepID=UPI0018EDD666|nr:hypothetical protein [Dyella sp. ASV21]
MRKTLKIQTAGLSLAAVLLAGVLPAYAAGQDSAAAQTTVSVQGVQVAIDAATGRLREPTAAERAALSKALVQQAALNRSAQQSVNSTDFVRPLTEQDAKATLRTLRLKSGVEVTAVDVPESLVSSLVAEKQADGSVVIHHQGDEAAHGKAKAQEVTE